MRDEVGLAGRNKSWGITTYNNIKKKSDEIQSGKYIPLAPKKNVRDFLSSHLIITGPLNGTRAVFELNVEDQCKFFERFPNCEKLILQSWKNPLSDLTLRCISMTMGGNLKEIDFSFSSVDMTTLEVLLVHFSKLEIAKFSYCVTLDGLAILALARLGSHSLKELFVDHCEKMNSESLLALSGKIGVSGAGLSKLEVLDLGVCPIDDRRLKGLATGCSQLRFLNLQDCRDITDIGVIAILQKNKHIQLLCLSGCIHLTNKSAKAIGQYCIELTSLNLSLCSKITNIGIKEIAKSCHNIQNANLSGLIRLSEASIAELATSSPGLLMLNITGCELVTPNGLKALIEGLKYVDPGVSFMGFKPKDKHIEQKLLDRYNFIRGHAIEIIRTGLVNNRMRKLRIAEMEVERINNAARLLQHTLIRYRRRLFFYNIWLDKHRVTCALRYVWISRSVAIT